MSKTTIEDDLFSNGIMDLNSALEFAEGMMDAPGYGDMQDALGVLAKAYRKAEDRIGELLVKAAALSRAEALLAEAREGLNGALGIFSNCTVTDGVCCCGDDMEKHPNPMNCGHSPVDHGAYVADQWCEATAALLAKLEQG